MPSPLFCDQQVSAQVRAIPRGCESIEDGRTGNMTNHRTNHTMVLSISWRIGRGLKTRLPRLPSLC